MRTTQGPKLPERNFNDYTGMIHEIAKKYSPILRQQDRMWGYDDVFGIAGEAFIKTVQREKRGKITGCTFITALYRKIVQDIKLVIRDGNRDKRKVSSYLEDIEDYQEALTYNTSKYHFLTEEAQEVLHLLKDTPKELVELSKSMGYKAAITRYLKITKSWKPRKLDAFWREHS